MNLLNNKFIELTKILQFPINNQVQVFSNSNPNLINSTNLFKKGGTIKIKEKNKGSFTRYCGGNVTSECISRGKNSPNPKIRKKATFAANARKWKHQRGGIISSYNIDKLNDLLKQIK